MRFLVTGGGTGGHIYPALAIARGLKSRYSRAEILYVGTARGMEADIVPHEGLPFMVIAAAGLQRKLAVRNLLALMQAGRGFCQAVGIIRSWRPDVVIGTGGYVCGPVVLAAALMGIPTLIHEQNALPGLTNRILSLFVDMIAVTFTGSARYFKQRKKVRLTGLPVRPEIIAAKTGSSREKLGLTGGRIFLLSFGGSRGAHKINKAMIAVIKMYAGDPRLKILHVTGTAGHGEFLDDCAVAGIDLGKYGNITVESYVYNMHDFLAAANLVVSRAGAATLAELTVLGIPSILVPYPHASEDHQTFNARDLENGGAALVIPDRQLSGDLLCRRVAEMLEDKTKLSGMAAASKKMGRKHALEDIMDCVDELAGASRKKKKHSKKT